MRVKTLVLRLKRHNRRQIFPGQFLTKGFGVPMLSKMSEGNARHVANVNRKKGHRTFWSVTGDGRYTYRKDGRHEYPNGWIHDALFLPTGRQGQHIVSHVGEIQDHHVRVVGEPIG